MHATVIDYTESSRKDFQMGFNTKCIQRQGWASEVAGARNKQLHYSTMCIYNIMILMTTHTVLKYLTDSSKGPSSGNTSSCF